MNVRDLGLNSLHNCQAEVNLAGRHVTEQLMKLLVGEAWAGTKRLERFLTFRIALGEAVRCERDTIQKAEH